MSQKTRKFILVEPKVYDRVSILIASNADILDNPELKQTIKTLLKTGTRTTVNPAPDKNMLGVFWQGDLVVKVES